MSAGHVLIGCVLALSAVIFAFLSAGEFEVSGDNGPAIARGIVAALSALALLNAFALTVLWGV